MNIAKIFFPLKNLFAENSYASLNKQILISFSHLRSNKFDIAKSAFFPRSFNIQYKRNHMDLPEVIKIFEEKVPPNLAESWDNTGLLIEPSIKTKVSTIFFTNDLTEAVLKEAQSVKSDLIIAYHPPIFAPMKCLKMTNWKDRIVIRCLENSIALYSPHTNCDAVQNGVNDWLINCFDLSDCHPIHTSHEKTPKYSYMVDFSAPPEKEILELIKSLPDAECYLSDNSGIQMLRVKVNKTSLNTIVQLLSDSSASTNIAVSSLNTLPIPSCGMGRIGKLVQPLPLAECLKLVKNYLKLEHVRFSKGISHSLESLVSTVAVCAGSGANVLKGCVADLYVTGEMSHHDLLDAQHSNVSVLLCEHSNSERGYITRLAEELKPKLPGLNFIISAIDEDPVRIV